MQPLGSYIADTVSIKDTKKEDYSWLEKRKKLKLKHL